MESVLFDRIELMGVAVSLTFVVFSDLTSVNGGLRLDGFCLVGAISLNVTFWASAASSSIDTSGEADVPSSQFSLIERSFILCGANVLLFNLTEIARY